MRILNTFLVLMLTLSLQLGAKEYGNAITLTTETKISKILENPEEFVGKKVLVSGMITSVCKKRGCWMNLASDKNFEQIQIKVVDGVIVFPMSAHGKMAKVEGVVERLGQYIPKDKKAHNGDGRSHTKNKYRIKALGATISE